MIPNTKGDASIPRGLKKFRPFKEGVLCFVVLRKYQGKGRPVLILHRAKAKEFGYGAFGAWTAPLVGIKDRSTAAEIGALGGKSKSAKKSAASRRNIAKAREAKK